MTNFRKLISEIMKHIFEQSKGSQNPLEYSSPLALYIQYEVEQGLEQVLTNEEAEAMLNELDTSLIQELIQALPEKNKDHIVYLVTAYNYTGAAVRVRTMANFQKLMSYFDKVGLRWTSGHKPNEYINVIVNKETGEFKYPIEDLLVIVDSHPSSGIEHYMFEFYNHKSIMFADVSVFEGEHIFFSNLKLKEFIDLHRIIPDFV